MSGEQKTLYKLSKTLDEVSRSAADSFTGLGMVIYNEIFNYGKYCLNMRPSEKCSQKLCLGDPETSEYLLGLSEASNNLHDGFTLFRGPELTHVAQLFSPPIVKTATPNEIYGSRYHTALLGANVEGVDAIGTVSSGGEPFIFCKLPYEKDINIMGVDEILKFIEEYESRTRKKIEILCEEQYIKQIAVLLILAHIFKNPSAVSQIDHVKFALGLNNVVA